MPICLHTDPGAASALGLVKPHEIPISRVAQARFGSPEQCFTPCSSVVQLVNTERDELTCPYSN